MRVYFFVHENIFCLYTDLKRWREGTGLSIVGGQIIVLTTSVLCLQAQFLLLFFHKLFRLFLPILFSLADV
jgi:hypothetical protein